MMSMVLTDKLIGMALRGRLRERGPWGEAMHLALKNPVQAEPMALGWKRSRITAHVDAWEVLETWCQERGIYRHGEAHDRHQQAIWFRNNGLKITTQLDRLAAHPGYRDIAVLGDSAIVLPARKLPSDDRYWPTMRRALARAVDLGESELVMGELVPVRVKLRQRVFTRWTFCSTTSAQEEHRVSPQR